MSPVPAVLRVALVVLALVPVAAAAAGVMGAAPRDDGAGAPGRDRAPAAVELATASTRAAPLVVDPLTVARALLAEPSSSRPRVVPRPHWDAAPVPLARLKVREGDLRQKLRYLVVHHTDFDPAAGPLAILEYHRTVSGFADIGYHFVIADDGTIYEGRDLRAVGAHAGAVRGQRGHPELDPDHRAVGIVLDGYFVDAPPGPAQVRALFALLDDLRARLLIAPERVITHRDVKDVLVEARGLTLASPETACPGAALAAVVDAYRAARAGR